MRYRLTHYPEAAEPSFPEEDTAPAMAAFAAYARDLDEAQRANHHPGSRTEPGENHRARAQRQP